MKNARGERTYDFPGAKAQQSYEVLATGLFFIDRRMSLEGRVNLIFEEITPTQTRVTASTRYVVKKDITIRDVEGRTRNLSDTVTFNSGGSTAFPAGQDGRATECAATGAIERDILSVLQ